MDNEGAIAMGLNYTTNHCNKHIDIKYHYIRDLLHQGKITGTYCRTAEMAADPLTKPLGRFNVQHHEQSIGLSTTG